MQPSYDDGHRFIFVLSCALCLSSADLAEAKRQNVSILSFLANYIDTPLIAYVGPFVATIAIAKSFLGHYLGASEGLHGLMAMQLQNRLQSKHLYYVIDVFMIITCWVVATLNPSILSIIEILVGPIIASILFLMPMYAISRVPAMQAYRNTRISNYFVMIMGVIAISAILYGIICQW